VVLIILMRRSATPSHSDLAFTHNTLTFSFAWLCRHCPIRIHHTHRLSRADFDLFLPPHSQTIGFFQHCSGSFCLFLFRSSLVVHSYLSSLVWLLRQQADRFWMSHTVRLIPSAPSVSFSSALCANDPLSLLSAWKGKGGSGVSQHELFPSYFCSLPLFLPSLETKWHLQRDTTSPWEPLLFLVKEDWREWWKAMLCKGGKSWSVAWRIAVTDLKDKKKGQTNRKEDIV